METETVKENLNKTQTINMMAAVATPRGIPDTIS